MVHKPVGKLVSAGIEKVVREEGLGRAGRARDSTSWWSRQSPSLYRWAVLWPTLRACSSRGVSRGRLAGD
jgi:hypothetical protein